MTGADIGENVRNIKSSLPSGVKLLAAAKTRSGREIQKAIEAGVEFIGHNYVQEAEVTKGKVKGQARWHMIGHLQRNKVKKALELFDLIESLDSVRLAKEINKRCGKQQITMPALVEINSGREKNKYGVLPSDARDFVLKVSEEFPRVKIQGLMTMGPFSGSADDFRPYFKTTRQIFEELKEEENENFSMDWLSMGMTASYKVAVEEGANLVRLGTAIFGPRSSG